MPDIDWGRMASPQADGYDTDIILPLAAKMYEFVKVVPTEKGWLDGQVALVDDGPSPSDQLPPAPVTHPSVALGEQYLQAWPAAFTQAQRLLQAVYLFDWTLASGQGRGCFCGTIGRRAESRAREDASPFGLVFSTVFDPVGFVEGVVHEMAHWKLHALGVHFEDWDGTLLLNSEAEEYVSSVRKDKLRPMGAVLHAHWVYVHVLALDLIILPLRPTEHTADLANIQNNLTRTLEGQATIDKNARWTDAGADFWKGTQEWTEQLVAQARSLA